MTIRGYVTLGLYLFFGAAIGANLLLLASHASCPHTNTLVVESLQVLAIFLGLVALRVDGIPPEHPHRRRIIIDVALAGLCLGLLIG